MTTTQDYLTARTEDAAVILHPALREQLVADAMDEIAACEADIDDLTKGRTLPEEYGPEFAGPGGKGLALEALEIAWGLAQERLDRLMEETQ